MLKKMPAFLALSMLFAWSIYAAGASAQITASGCSVSNVGYLADLAKEYEKRTGKQVLVRGGGSVVGLDDLHANRVDFAASCRGKEPDDPAGLEFVQVAWDVLVPIVHPSNPLTNISPENIRNVFFGKTTAWEQLRGGRGPIMLFLSRPGKGLSGVESSTRMLVLQGKSPVIAANVNTQVSSGVVEQMVEKTPGGFAVSGFASARKRHVKMLQVNGVTPSMQSIRNNTYPFKRPLYLVVSTSPKPEVKRFIDFALSREGQELIHSFGVVPIAGAQ